MGWCVFCPRSHPTLARRWECAVPPLHVLASGVGARVTATHPSFVRTSYRPRCDAGRGLAPSRRPRAPRVRPAPSADRPDACPARPRRGVPAVNSPGRITGRFANHECRMTAAKLTIACLMAVFAILEFLPASNSPSARSGRGSSSCTLFLVASSRVVDSQHCCVREHSGFSCMHLRQA